MTRWRIILTATVVLIMGAGAIWLSRDSRDERVARALTGGDPERAPALLTRYGCGGCHTIPGVPGADGRVGPPLGGLKGRVYIAGVLPNTTENLLQWLRDPPAHAPGTAMPPTGINEAEARDVAAWLYAH
ncbi:c-type cytochrome [Roseococcus sp. YIM B11640]|uniref:c-type cytochrome n=1 Tax=Roseococcus sp. YIM B11640 TaxID=3133973 RepID=UPI003C7D50A6